MNSSNSFVFREQKKMSFKQRRSSRLKGAPGDKTRLLNSDDSVGCPNDANKHPDLKTFRKARSLGRGPLLSLTRSSPFPLLRHNAFEDQFARRIGPGLGGGARGRHNNGEKRVGGSVE